MEAKPRPPATTLECRQSMSTVHPPKWPHPILAKSRDWGCLGNSSLAWPTSPSLWIRFITAPSHRGLLARQPIQVELLKSSKFFISCSLFSGHCPSFSSSDALSRMHWSQWSKVGFSSSPGLALAAKLCWGKLKHWADCLTVHYEHGCWDGSGGTKGRRPPDGPCGRQMTSALKTRPKRFRKKLRPSS